MSGPRARSGPGLLVLAPSLGLGASARRADAIPAPLAPAAGSCIKLALLAARPAAYHL